MTVQTFTAVLLNLDRDTARLAHMNAQLDRAGIVFTRQAGIVGDAVPDALRPVFFNADGAPRTTMKRGEIGCYASHLQVLKNIAGGIYGDIVLVMEDDLTIAPDFLAIVARMLPVLPADWDIVRLSNPPRRAYVRGPAIDDKHHLVRYSKIPNSAGAYLITRAGAQKFIAHGVRGLTFDDDLRRPWFHGMNSYGVLPPPICAGATRQSSIDAMEGGRFDKPFNSRMERLLRGDHAHALRRVAYNWRYLGAMNWLTCQAVNLGAMLVWLLRRRSLSHGVDKCCPGARRDA